MVCGRLTVPLDYTEPESNATLNLQLQKIEAPSGTSNGSILFNFGGPGASGHEDFAYYGELLSVVTGGNHDLINLVPRGTGVTIPFSCYPSNSLRTYAQLLNPTLCGNASDVALGENWANAEVFGNQCYMSENKTGGLVGTAFVARDLMQVVDALEEDGMLRYWGVSYGTLLGATTAAMFPERMDKVILDGVVNPYEYYANHEVQLFDDVDDVFAGFCSGCVNNPKNCPWGGNITAEELQESIYAFLDRIKYEPIVVPSAIGGSVIDYTTVKSLLVKGFDQPATWPSIAAPIQELMAGNSTAFEAYMTQLASTPAIQDEAQFGIKCGDAFGRTNSLKEIKPLIEARHNASRIAGDSADYVAMRCARWPMAAKERYSGNFHVQTKNPVLLIGNTYDPVTPISSARNVSAAFKGSVLLQHDSYGHDSLVQASLCTAKAVMAYFNNSTLPEKGTKCPVNATLFSGEDGWTGVLRELTGNSSITAP